MQTVSKPLERSGQITISTLKAYDQKQYKIDIEQNSQTSKDQTEQNQ